MQDVQTIFDRYEAIRPRLPAASTGSASTDIASLLDIADQVEAFVFDAFGVLNVGEVPIPGAAARLDALRAKDCAIRVLTNAASYDRAGAVEKFARLGLDIRPPEIVTSRDATLQHLDTRRWGAIAAPEDALSDLPGKVLRLGDAASDYETAEGFVFLSTSGWTDTRQALLEDALRAHPRPLMIANADLVAPRDDGFSLEPGHYGHLLIDRLGCDVRFFGKPFPEVYALAERTLQGIAPSRIAMCGDTLHTDIMGAAARGWKTVLVTGDGLFSGADTTRYCGAAGLFADWRLPRI